MEPILSKVVVTQNSWTNRVMPVDELEKIAVSVFGEDRVLRARYYARCHSNRC